MKKDNYNNAVTVTLFGKTEKWRDRNNAITKYIDHQRFCKARSDKWLRYQRVLEGLLLGKTEISDGAPKYLCSQVQSQT